jgi:hypothetical protein
VIAALDDHWHRLETAEPAGKGVQKNR